MSPVAPQPVAPAAVQKPPGKMSRVLDFIRRHWKAALIIGVAVLVVAGGLIGFFAWKTANDNKIVSVESGTIWVCTQCGKEYKNDVETVQVKNKDKSQYKVVTKKEGVCDTCAFGPTGYKFKTLFDTLNSSEYFKTAVEIPQPAKDFIKAHPECFPAASQGVADSFTNPVDPRLVNRDYTQYTGGLVKVYGSVIKTESIPFGDGKLTFLQISPENSSDSWFVFYPGDTDVLDQDYGNFWVLPMDTTQYEATMGTRTALVTIGSLCQKTKKPWEY